MTAGKSILQYHVRNLLLVRRTAISDSTTSDAGRGDEIATILSPFVSSSAI